MRNMKRFYLVSVQSTLIGEYCVVRMIGRIGSSVRILPPLVFPSAATAQQAAEQLVARKKRRGYTATNDVAG